MAWIELTVHWIVSDCDLGEVSGYTPSKGCVGLRVYGLHTGVRGTTKKIKIRDGQFGL